MPTKCTLAPQHKWVFQRNVVSSKGVGGGVTKLSLRGKYRCACGETRIGAVNQNAPNADLGHALAAQEQ